MYLFMLKLNSLVVVEWIWNVKRLPDKCAEISWKNENGFLFSSPSFSSKMQPCQKRYSTLLTTTRYCLGSLYKTSNSSAMQKIRGFVATCRSYANGGFFCVLAHSVAHRSCIEIGLIFDLKTKKTANRNSSQSAPGVWKKITFQKTYILCDCKGSFCLDKFQSGLFSELLIVWWWEADSQLVPSTFDVGWLKKCHQHTQRTP